VTTPIEQSIWSSIRSGFGDFESDRTKKDKVHFKRKLFRGLTGCKPWLAASFGLPQAELQCFFSNKDTGSKTAEYMGFDFTITTYPRNRDFAYAGSKTRWPASRYEILLAVESEAVAYNASLRQYRKKLLEDFIKLLDVRSRIKAMVYRPPTTHREEGFSDAKEIFEAVLSRHRHLDDKEKWMFVGIPWYKKQFPRDRLPCCQVHLLDHANKELVTAPWPVA
jgi:hypothetical protein